MTHCLRVGVGGPVGSGKTALLRQLCTALRDHYDIAVVTNDIYTREDADFLLSPSATPAVGAPASVPQLGEPRLRSSVSRVWTEQGAVEEECFPASVLH